MNFKLKRIIFWLILLNLTLNLCTRAFTQEIFIYRPKQEKNVLSLEGTLTVHGEFFGHLQTPSTYPSYNDLSGSIDRWNFGFQNIIFFTPATRFIAQLITHDNGQKRTKFDWHFSLRQKVADNLVFIIGHDSNHDSDHTSLKGHSMYFLNRNYIGFGIPFETGSLYVEPFTWFFHHSNQRNHLDMSGEEVKQEYGFRIGYVFDNGVSLHSQIFAQTDELFASGLTYRASLFIRIQVFTALEISLGSSIWKDLKSSPMGNKDKFYKLMWGIVVPF